MLQQGSARAGIVNNNICVLLLGGSLQGLADIAQQLVGTNEEADGDDDEADATSTGMS